MWDNQLTNLLTRAQRGIETILSPDEADSDYADQEQPVELRIELGRTRLQPQDVERLRSGSVLALDGPLGEPAAIYAGAKLIGRGEVVVVDGRIGVRVVELCGLQETA